MFARVIEARIRPEKQQEFRSQVLPNIENTLRRQAGLLEIVALNSEKDPTLAVSITFWRSEDDIRAYEKNTAPEVLQKVRPFLQAEPSIRVFSVETTTGKKIATAAA